MPLPVQQGRSSVASHHRRPGHIQFANGVSGTQRARLASEHTNCDARTGATYRLGSWRRCTGRPGCNRRNDRLALIGPGDGPRKDDDEHPPDGGNDDDTRHRPVLRDETLMHLMMGVAFAIIHTLLFQTFDLDSDLVIWGIVFRVGHWVIAGMGLGMIAGTHPMM